jgi:predicted AAA+ superfamily ATPase
MRQALKEALKLLIKDWHVKPFPIIKERESWKLNLERFKNILAIIWPRRAGKTYFMYQIAEHLIANGLCEKEDILFLDFENPQLIELQTIDFAQLVKLYYEAYGKKPKYLFFDEIQNINNWWKVLRSFHNDEYEMVISGSSSKLLLTEISTELRGRYSHKLMLPFSFTELLGYNNLNPKKLEYTSASWSILKVFDAYMEFGWFPKIVSVGGSYEKKQELEEYYKTTFYRDFIERHNVQDKYAFELLMKYALDMYSSILVPSKFWDYVKPLWVDISKPTVLKYLSYLREWFFLIECQKFWRSPKVSLTNPRKVYLIDPGFIRLARNFTENKWKILENIVAIHLFRSEQEFYYFDEWKECDFVIKHKFGLQITHAIQVTRELEHHDQDREINGLIQAMEKCKLKEGYILTYNQSDILEKDGYTIHVMPVWKWMIEFVFDQ